LQAKSTTDIAVRVVTDIGFGIIIFFIFFVFILPHIVAIAEALDDQTIAFSTAVKLITLTSDSE